MKNTLIIFCTALLIFASANSVLFAQTISGELKQWHKVTLAFTGPSTTEQAEVNPFTDYRLNVTFTGPSGQTYRVPGYFAADGNAANTSAEEGSSWFCHLAPDEVGVWNYEASFITGDNVAVDESETAGEATSFDGSKGNFTIATSDKTGRDFRSKGMLKYVGKHHLQFAGNGEYFLKQGADAPENLLAYNDFDGTTNKSWNAHIQDWNEGDPTWQDTKGKGLIGAVNYLASEGMNVFSFLTMNIQGDDKKVFPYPSDKKADRLRIDVSKTAQWEIIFEHADKMGMYLHFKTQETENDHLLDGGDLGPERKLYYRELIARFGHHLALNWNLGEENVQSIAQVKDMAQYFNDHDPYQHNIVLHTYPGQYDRYASLTGDQSKLTGTSIQGGNANFSDIPGLVSDWVKNSADAGKPWVVAVDEPGDASHAIRPDDDAGNSHEDGRKNALWGTIMNGGAGCEYYFGYSHGDSDLSCQDWRSRDQWWDYCRYALEFFKNNNVPFWDMSEDDSKVSNGWCLAKENHTYVIYFPNGVKTTTIELGSGEHLVDWFDPRNGGELQEGSIIKINQSGAQDIGTPPDNETEDWICLVRKKPEHSLPGRIEAEKFSSQKGIIVKDNASVISGIDHKDWTNYMIEALVGETFDLDIKVNDAKIGTNIILSIDNKIVDTVKVETLTDTLSTALHIDKGIHELTMLFLNELNDSSLLEVDYVDAYGPTKFYTIQASSTLGGTINPDGTLKIKEGESIEYLFEAEIGYIPDSIWVDGTMGLPASSYTFSNVQTDHLIVANFTECEGSIPNAFMKINDNDYVNGNEASAIELDDVILKAEYDDDESFYWIYNEDEISDAKEFEITEIAYSQAGIYSTVHTNSQGCKGKFDFDVKVDYIQLDVYQAEDWNKQSGLETKECFDIGGSDYVTSIENNDWSMYTVNIDKTAIYDFTFRMKNVTDGAYILVSVDDVALTAIQLDKSDLDEWYTTKAVELTLDEGERELSFTYKGNSGSLLHFNWFNLEYNRVVSINEARNNFNCYPNPMINELNISGGIEIKSISIFNAMGVQAMEFQNTNGSIDISELNSGVYFIKITTIDHKVEIKKMTKL